MNYNSTRDNTLKVSAASAIATGIAPDGGLFVPETVPTLSENDFNALKGMNYIERAVFIFKKFLTDFTEQEIEYCAKGAYSGTFENDVPAPLYTLKDGTHILELWHGPTCAFKDLALQILPYLLTTSAKKVSKAKETVILVATSGDTGKAALEGFCDVEGTKIVVFYPSDGVSPMQKHQMCTQKGENVSVCAIKGNFDDAQSAVKKIFTDSETAKLLEKNGMQFSSANSINWGRLAPQIIYYVSAYCDLLKENDAVKENGFNIVVPTGNFGNILAAYYAKKMGVPVKRLICASNANNVLTDFLKTGTYNKNRDFYTTVSPSMDILISSNLERMLYELSDHDDAFVAKMQSDLAQKGMYTVSDKVKARFNELFYGGCCDDESTLKTIKETWEKFGYLCDTHTAVAVNVYNSYVKETGDNTQTVIASTASPYKFCASVLSAFQEKAPEKEFDAVDLLSAKTGVKIPEPLLALKDAKVRFTDICEKDKIEDFVLNYLKI